MAKGVLFREVSSIPGCPYRRSEQDAPLASPASINYLELSKHDNPKCSTRSSSGVSRVWVVLLYDHKETQTSWKSQYTQCTICAGCLVCSNTV